MKVVYEGVEIHCETPEQAVEVAVELAAKLRGTPVTGMGARNGTRSPVADLSGSRWTTTRFKNFTSMLREKQRKVLRELLQNPDGITDVVLRQSLNLSDNRGIGPIFTAMSRRAKKVGMSFQDVVISEKSVLTSGERVLEFKAAPSFVAICQEAGGMK